MNNIVLEVKRRRWTWLGHVLRMKKGRHPLKALSWAPLGRGTGADHSALGGGPSRTRWKQLERRGTSCGGWPRTGLNGRSLSVPYAPLSGAPRID